MIISRAQTKSIPVALLDFGCDVDDHDIRRLLVKGFAYEQLSSLDPALIIAIQGPDYLYTWLAIRNPDGLCLVEYSMYADLLPLEGHTNLRVFAVAGDAQ